ncbi:ATP-binding protein [Crocosphaera sp.]|uniref:ATP-binding protein n=1 Tax=Crocosphaera sp. TaxID=2729996 RepID=UPI0026362A66|nr:ATP-binding protein [Crocosphaera sp.]MDJ0582119.1 ATP-binding protein [Crocosphaera sp.]
MNQRQNQLDNLDNNDHFLSLALKWLSLRLRELAGEEIKDTEIHKTYMTMETVASQEPYPAFVYINHQFGLSSFEEALLLLCVSLELDPTIAGLCGKAQQDPNLCYPTFFLATSLFQQSTWNTFSPTSPLFYWGLLEINQRGHQPFITSPLQADQQIVNYIRGLYYLDQQLASFLMLIDPPNNPLPASQQGIVDQIITYLQHCSQGNLPIIQLLGTDGSSKQLIAAHIATCLGFKVYHLPLGLLPNQIFELKTFLRRCNREAKLIPMVLYLDTQEQDSSNETISTALLNHCLSGYHGLLFLDTRKPYPQINRTTLSFDVSKPTVSEQEMAWTQMLGDRVSNETPSLLANQFNFNLPTIEINASLALSEPIKKQVELHNRLWNLCLINSRPQLNDLAQLIETKATWDDLVLPKEEIALLRQIRDQVRQRTQVYETWGFQQRMNRGLGISAMFAGESGTGKTMAAEVIANSLSLNLYRIDLSGVVDKYIGETEKNLRRLFDAAEGGGAILFFDEADALFGKRSQVKDSHDRYANIEVNYLLQRLESYKGLAILATNLKSSLDSAFLRRLRFIINFPFPGKSERQQMWQKVFPKETPIEALDFERLGAFNLAGGSIHNIAVNAAFLAAQAGTSVTMSLVLSAVKTEFRKLERPINESDFR